MIVNIRGTSGSGKTTVVRQFLKFATTKTRVKERNSAKIIGYMIEIGLDRPVFVMGPYEEKSSGGCDNFRDLAKVFSEVHYWHEHGFHVIFEGLLISRSKGRVIELWNALGRKNLLILHLMTPLEDCLEGIRQRRMQRSNFKPVDRARTEETFHRAYQISRALIELGIPGALINRNTAAEQIKDILQNERYIPAACTPVL